MHTLLGLKGSIPASTWIPEARLADVRILNALVPEPGSIYLLDRAFIDFLRLCHEWKGSIGYGVRLPTEPIGEWPFSGRGGSAEGDCNCLGERPERESGCRVS